MDIVRAVFEHGLEVRLEGALWRVSSGPQTAECSFASLSDAVQNLAPLRPLLVTDEGTYGDHRNFLLCCDGRGCFGLRVSDLMQMPHGGDSFLPMYHLAYLLSAIEYHCVQLAELYANIARRYWKLQQVDGFANDSEWGVFDSDQTAHPYFEFEALVGAARRSIDTTRYLLWNRFGPRKGSTPRSLEVLLNSPSSMPPELHDELVATWQRVGIPLTHYRDCIHHYVPVDYGMASATMRRLPSRAWTTMIRIPDNPEARSKARFTFAQNRDALTYAWELSDEVLRVALSVAKATTLQKADA